ncbi:MATE family efflux transporter [Marinifilum flexuosum]|uniref:MATE family multidrug resistance protein n=1 Tax=Marinifilum flexuosum TaxID=1117708 RepID=A0A419X7R3_9BACT|nr:MATE family efflux transporter [Marinifilum flexuosum]RKE03798.1 MATE family multidrug resistance protein [Marinifilum flexuosum]
MNKKILNIAVPNIVSNITIPLLGLVDLALMGHLGKVDFIGAIALGGTIFNFLYWGFAFLRMGTTGITAQAYGARNLSESILSLSRALTVALAGSILILILQKPIAMLSFWLIESEESVETIAKSYFYIRVWAAPATIGLYALNGWFIGMQNAKTPMLIAIAGNVINISLSAFFVYGLMLDAKGVALGTLIAQYCSLFIALFFILRNYKRLFKYWSAKGMMKVNELKHFFLVNKDIFIRTLCIIFVFTFFTTESASVNKEILAVNSLLLQFLFIFSYFMDGFAFAAEALVGKFIGANNSKNLSQLIRLLFIWGIVISILFTGVYGLFGIDILSILTDAESTLAIARDYLKWIILLPLLSFASFLMDGIFIGATASSYMRKTMMAATILIFIPLYYFLNSSLENHGLWIAMLGFMFARGLFQAIYYKKAVLIHFSK